MKKIISILMISIVCISNFIGIFGTNKVKAAIAPIENAKPYSKGEVVLFSYDGIAPISIFYNFIGLYFVYFLTICSCIYYFITYF